MNTPDTTPRLEYCPYFFSEARSSCGPRMDSRNSHYARRVIEPWINLQDSPRRKRKYTSKRLLPILELKQIFTIPSLSGHIIFKGGTSPSKVFHVINRFSEDIDISVSKEILGISESQDPESACKSFVTKQLYKDLYAAIKALLGTPKDWTLEVDPADEQTLLFNYPPATESKSDYIPRRLPRDMKFILILLFGSLIGSFVFTSLIKLLE